MVAQEMELEAEEMSHRSRLDKVVVRGYKATTRILSGMDYNRRRSLPKIQLVADPAESLCTRRSIQESEREWAKVPGLVEPEVHQSHSRLDR